MKTNTRHWAAITAGILSLAGYASAAPIGSEKYTYDASGNITSKSNDGVVTKMAYDQANRLIELQTAGQGKESTAYDNAGRPVTERNADGQTIRSLSYGYGDKVLETQTQDLKAGFFYNAEGQLVGKKTDGNVSTYSWDGNVLAAEGANAFTNEAHVTGGVPVISGGMAVMVTDFLGSTLLAEEQTFTSTAFGEGLEKARFTGKPFIKELGGYLFPFRLYDSSVCAWTKCDPSGYPDGPNNLVYGGNNPLTHVDPLGLVTHNLTANEVFIPVPPEYANYDPGSAVKTESPTISSTQQGDCFIAITVGSFAFSTYGHYNMPNIGNVQVSTNPDVFYIIDAVTIQGLERHEEWHHTHHTTLADATFGALEFWSAAYYGNYFSSQAAADSNGNTDMTNARSLAQMTFTSNYQKSYDHVGGYYPILADSNQRLRSQDADATWGSSLNITFSNISPNFLKTVGNCEN